MYRKACHCTAVQFWSSVNKDLRWKSLIIPAYLLSIWVHTATLQWQQARLFNLMFSPIQSTLSGLQMTDSTAGNPSCLKWKPCNLQPNIAVSLVFASVLLLGLCFYSCDLLEEGKQGVAQLVPPLLSSGCTDTQVIMLPFAEPRRSSQGGANKQTS